MTTPEQPIQDATFFRDQQYITEARQHARDLLEAITALEAMQTQWNALDYGNTLTNGAGANEGITPANVGAVVFATANSMRGVLNDGNATNIAKIL